MFWQSKHAPTPSVHTYVVYKLNVYIFSCALRLVYVINFVFQSHSWWWNCSKSADSTVNSVMRHFIITRSIILQDSRHETVASAFESQTARHVWNHSVVSVHSFVDDLYRETREEVEIRTVNGLCMSHEQPVRAQSRLQIWTWRKSVRLHALVFLQIVVPIVRICRSVVLVELQLLLRSVIETSDRILRSQIKSRA